ncbi:hypothetical protein DL95DRAFT_390510, partial [Leptodontidium sp. 2 PMI_412]
MQFSSLLMVLAVAGTMAQTTTCTAVKTTVTAHAVLAASTSSKLSNSTLATSTRLSSSVYLGSLVSSPASRSTVPSHSASST